MQALLMQNGKEDIRAYFVWGPFLKSDTAATARECTSRYWAPNSSHFWTPSPRIALELASVLQLPAGRSAWDVYLLFKRGIVWDRVFPLPTYWQQQLEVLQGDRYDPRKMSQRLKENLTTNDK